MISSPKIAHPSSNNGSKKTPSNILSTFLIQRLVSCNSSSRSPTQSCVSSLCSSNRYKRHLIRLLRTPSLNYSMCMPSPYASEHCETMNLERLKVRLFKLCSTKEAFEHIDTLNNSYVNFKDVDRFFRRNGLIIYEDELTRFLMRVDIGYTGSLSANDFRRILTPIYESEELSMQRRISQSSQVG